MDRDAESRAFRTPDDLAGIDFTTTLGEPGVFPFTRGIQLTGRTAHKNHSTGCAMQTAHTDP